LETSLGKQFVRLYLEKSNTKYAGGVAQGEDPAFKPEYHKKKKRAFKGK
jgi:hypothetical protein